MTVMLSPNNGRQSGANKVDFFSSRQSGQIPAAVCIGFECCCNGQNVSNRTFRDMTPVWDQRGKNCHNRDLEPKLWDDKGEKSNVTGKY